MTQSGERANGVSWSGGMPWLLLLRVFRIAVSIRLLALAAVGALLTSIVWGFWAWSLGVGAPLATTTDERTTPAVAADVDRPQAAIALAVVEPAEPIAAGHWLAPYRQCSWLAVVNMVPDQPTLPLPTVAAPIPSGADRTDPVTGPWRMISAPVMASFRANVTFREILAFLLCGLSSLAIWAFFGAAVTRIAAVQLAAEESITTTAALRHACGKWASYFCAPLLPALGIFLAALPIAVLALLIRVGLGVLVAAVLWPVFLALGAVMALLLVGVIFGWPLMWATISTEGTDAFDALSRSFAYVYQNALRYLFYAAVAALLGWLGWLFVYNFAAVVVWMTYWAAAWGAGGKFIGDVIARQETGALAHTTAVLIRFWAGCVKLLAVGYLFSYFWVAAVAIYLLLRRDVDATEMDEVYLEADESETSALPPITSDATGAPVMAASESASGIAGRTNATSDTGVSPDDGISPAGDAPSAAGGGGGTAARPGDKFGHGYRDPNGEN